MSKQICIIIGVMLMCFSLYYLQNDIINLAVGWESRCSSLVLCILAYALFVWKKLGLNFYSPTFFFFISLFMFHLAGVMIIGIEEKPIYDEHYMLYRYGEGFGFIGVLYSLLFVEAYLVGVSIFSNAHMCEQRSQRQDVDYNLLYITRRIGYTLLSISILPTLYHDISQAIVKMSIGYGNMMTGDYDFTFYGIPLGYFTKLFLPSIILLLSSYRYEKNKFNKVALSAIVYYALMMVLTGRRGNTIQSFLPIIFMYFFLMRPKVKFVYILYIYALLFFVNFVSNSRQVAYSSSYVHEIKETILENDPIKDICLEMGGTIKAPIQAIMAIQATGDFQYGRSYIAAFFYSISCGLHIPIKTLDKYAMFNIYLEQPERGMDINSTVEYMGGSIIAEWFWNFGWLGIFLVLFLAALSCKYDNKLIEVSNKPVTLALYVCLLYYLSRWTRGYFYDVVWQACYIVVFLGLYVKTKYPDYSKYL